jgi:ParB family transcriptional regulator, chromosome partitioning protein
MSRKDTLRAMLTRRDERLPIGNSDVPDDRSAPHDEPKAVPHVAAGAVGAMRRSLGQIANAAEQARALIASGAAVVEIAPDQLDSSFVRDRLEGEGPAFDALVEAIREVGQRSPILVRPHPKVPDRYQIVFGHRRALAASRLARTVRAVVQNLTDEEVVLIQGQENSARTDLSYIERGLFALTLEEQGFDRRVIMSALGMEKTQLSKLLSLAHAIPRELVEAIGPARKAGRPRWEALAERLAQAKDDRVIDSTIRDPKFANLDSDSRFLRVFASLGSTDRPNRAKIEPMLGADGSRIAMIERSGSSLSITLDGAEVLPFGEYVASQLGVLHQEFLKQIAKEAREPN